MVLSVTFRPVQQLFQPYSTRRSKSFCTSPSSCKVSSPFVWLQGTPLLSVALVTDNLVRTAMKPKSEDTAISGK